MEPDEEGQQGDREWERSEGVGALTGLFFHTLHQEGEHKGKWRYQGRLVAHAGGGHYLALIYDTYGQPNYSVLVNIPQMTAENWRFYTTEQTWREAGEDLARRLY